MAITRASIVHQPEEGVCLFRLDRQIAQLVDQQGLHAAWLAEQPGGRAIGQRGVEFIEQDLSIIEAAAVAIEAGLAQQPDPSPVLPVPGLPMSRTLSARRRKSSPASVWICVLLTPGWRSKGKLSSDHRHGRRACARR